MLNKPHIILSALDVERIEKLLDNMPAISDTLEANLIAELERGDIVDSQAVPANVVTMNSTVRFKVSSTNETFCLTLVYPKDMRADGQTISILAPVGSALLGVTEGEQIDWPNAEGKTVRVTVEEILYQPERAGDYHR